VGKEMGLGNPPAKEIKLGLLVACSIMSKKSP